MIHSSFNYKDLELPQLNDPVLHHLLCMEIFYWTGINNHLHQMTQEICHSTAVAMKLVDHILFREKVIMTLILYNLILMIVTVE